MAGWNSFLVIAGAHFLALVSPGPDFFLIVRSSVVNGRRTASGVCVGIALANAVHILVAISGVAALQDIAGLLSVLKWSGCAYLAWLGVCFLRSRSQAAAFAPAGQTFEPGGWWRECRIGFLSGILNPKNSLFYASLFSLGIDPETPLALRLAYGAWMFAAVLGWDLAIARAAGHPPVVRRFIAHVRKIERITGVVLLCIAAGIARSG